MVNDGYVEFTTIHYISEFAITFIASIVVIVLASHSGCRQFESPSDLVKFFLIENRKLLCTNEGMDGAFGDCKTLA